jgi:hypothetical protein
VDKTATIYPSIAWWDGHYSLQQPDAMFRRWASHEFSTDWGLRDVGEDEAIYDPISYHQGSVWPLFTGWASVAEYRTGRTLSGYAHLMQNANLTWEQDLGAVTELLSGDYFAPVWPQHDAPDVVFGDGDDSGDAGTVWDFSEWIRTGGGSAFARSVGRGDAASLGGWRRACGFNDEARRCESGCSNEQDFATDFPEFKRWEEGGLGKCRRGGAEDFFTSGRGGDSGRPATAGRRDRAVEGEAR